MKSIIRFSMNNAVAVFIIILVIVAAGLYSVKGMKMEKYPNVDIPFMHVSISYPDASPEQAMEDIGKPLEQELGNLKHIENIYMVAYSNAVQATVQFSMSADLKAAETDMRDAIAKVKLPETAGAPQIRKSSPENPEAYQVGISGGTVEQARKFAQDTVQPKLRTIKGIANINISGLQDNKVYIRVRPAALLEHRITLDQVKQQILASHLSMPIGNITTADQTLPVRLDSGFASVDDVKKLPLIVPAAGAVGVQGAVAGAAAGSPAGSSTGSSTGSPAVTPALTLGDIADVTLASGSDSVSRMNGLPAVTIGIEPEAGQDVVSIVREAKAKVADSAVPQGIQVKVLVDKSHEIETSVYNMLREVLLGALMAVIVTLLFLNNIRSTIIAVISIPLSMLASLWVLSQLGYTLNILTLAGIAVAVGRVVDDSIVVIENIFRRVRNAQNRDAELVESATREVSSAITSSTITTVAVFLPLAFVPGIVGKYFVPLAWTIVISLLFSLLVAVTVVPLMSKLFLLHLKHKRHSENSLQRAYRSLLGWALRHRFITLAIAVVLLASSLSTAPLLGTNFLPAEKATNYSINITMPIGASTAKTDQVTRSVEKILSSRQEVDIVKSSSSGESGQVFFTVKDSLKASDSFAAQLRSNFSALKDAKNITLVGLSGVGGGNMAIIVNGPDNATIKLAGDQIVNALKGVKGLADVNHTSGGQKPEISVVLDKSKLAANGLMPAIVGVQLHDLLEGSTVAKAPIEGKTTDIVLGLAQSDNLTVDTLKQQKITNQAGAQIALQDLGEVKAVMNPISLQHLNQVEYLEIHGTITDANTGKVTADAENTIRALKLPDGVTWSASGASKELNDGFKNMGIALLISIILVYMVLLLSFGEPLVPFVILFAIPFSLIGALLGLFIVGEPIGMPAMIGALMLNGIVVTNAIVLLDRVRQNLRKGLSKHDALLEGGVTRLRPILMTAIATIGALLPLTLSADAGLISRALAVVVIGGLTTSTFLTLIIVPVLFSLLHPKGRVRQPYIPSNEGAPPTSV